MLQLEKCGDLQPESFNVDVSLGFLYSYYSHRTLRNSQKEQIAKQKAIRFSCHASNGSNLLLVQSLARSGIIPPIEHKTKQEMICFSCKHTVASHSCLEYFTITALLCYKDSAPLYFLSFLFPNKTLRNLQKDSLDHGIREG